MVWLACGESIRYVPYAFFFLVCERARGVTHRASRVMFLRSERGHVLLQQAGLPVSHKLRASSHAFLRRRTLTTLVQWCVTAGVKPPFRWHGCCDRSEGERHSHRTRSQRQQGGRWRRCCTCRRLEGNGFDVQEVCVQGVCSLSPQMSLHKVV